MTRLLFVDDDAAVRRVFARLFPRPAYDVDLAEDGMQALAWLDQHDYDVIVSDFRMPRMDGGEFLARACDRRPDAVRILVTAESDFDVAVRAVNRGEVFRLLCKPWDDDALQFVVRLAVDMRRMRRERDEMLVRLADETASLAVINEELDGLNGQLEARVRQRTRSIVETLVAALDFRDPEASRRARRTAAIACRIGTQLGLSTAALDALEQGVLLHDVGRLGIRDELFFKRGALTDEEWTEMRRYPQAGDEMLRPIEFLEEARRIVLNHRESWDGSGYPSALAGTSIALGARIFAVAEVIESALSDSSYGGVAGMMSARGELRRGASRSFDPDVVAAFLAVPAWEWHAMAAEPGTPDRTALLEVA